MPAITLQGGRRWRVSLVNQLQDGNQKRKQELKPTYDLLPLMKMVQLASSQLPPSWLVFRRSWFESQLDPGFFQWKERLTSIQKVLGLNPSWILDFFHGKSVWLVFRRSWVQIPAGSRIFFLELFLTLSTKTSLSQVYVDIFFSWD